MANFDVIVIGAGITGLSAAKAAVQSGLRTANIEALMFGGLVVNINELDGEPGSVCSWLRITALARRAVRTSP